MPVVCVDVLLVGDIAGQRNIGLIRRADGQGRVGWALIGGRIHRFETLREAVLRHLAETLAAEVEIGPFDVESPGMVAQYFPDDSRGERIDPAKHSISCSYVAAVKGEVPRTEARPGSEALGFSWFRIDERPAPDEYVHGHGTVVERLLGGT